MKATLKDGSIVEVKTGLAWGVEFGITMLDPEGFYPRDLQAVAFDSLMTKEVYLKCIFRCTCRLGSTMGYVPGYQPFWSY